MAEAAQKLPSDPQKLHAIIARMMAEKVEREQRFEAELQAREAELRTRNETIEKRDRQIELLLERLELLRHQRFGPKADRISKDQLALFDEAELNVLLEELDTQIAEAKAPPRSERSDVDPAHAGGVYCKGSGVSAGEGAGQSGFCSPGRIGAAFGVLKKFYLSYSGYDFYDQLKLTIL